MCLTSIYTQANTNNVNKTCALIQPTGNKDEQNCQHRFNSDIVTDIITRNSERKHRTGFNDAGLIPKLNNIIVQQKSPLDRI